LNPSVLIIEDEPSVSSALKTRLTEQGYGAFVAETGREGLARLEAGGIHTVLLDYRLPDADGLEVLKSIRRTSPDVPVVMMTAHGNVDVAVQAMDLGAADYVSKPFRLDEMILRAEKALEAYRKQSEVRQIHEQQQERFGFGRMVARNPQTLEILDLLRNLAGSEARTILLQGESGTGKDLAAKIIHYNSPRSERPFMNITCTALPEALLESELFGHEKGAFTDARETKQGLFELADGGTIYLDEIGDMPPSLQAKLLRFLEEKAFRRVGGTADIRVDVRIIAATNKDLKARVESGDFREDLYYRLNIFPITLPPLRDRPEEIPLLAERFIRNFNQEFHKDVRDIEPAALEVMRAYGWPGNVRELRNVVERAMLLADGGRLTVRSLPAEIRQAAAAAVAEPNPEDPGASVGHADAETAEPVVRLGNGGVDLKEVERQLVEQAIERTDGNQSRAAELLGITRDQLRYRLEKFGLKNRTARQP
jgi:DNA-binding NtrC family response regulator